MDTDIPVQVFSQSTSSSSPLEKPNFYNVLATALYRLQASYERGDKATLAILRRAAGKTPEKDPLAWSCVLDTLLPDFSVGKDDNANSAELAAFIALTLYALHQRSLHTPMHQKGNKSLGTAVAELTLASDSKSIKSRLDTLMVARTASATSYHLRSLISLLHAYEIPLDYAQLACDLRKLYTPFAEYFSSVSARQKSYDLRESVILRWGRDYASTLSKQAPTKDS